MHCWNGFLLASCLALAPLQKGDTATPDAQEETQLGRPVNAKELLERFAKMEGLEVSFSEKKHIALLAVPLESKGKIYFMRPGFLSRVIETPTKSSLTITPDELRMVNSREDKTVDLRQNADLRILVTSLLRVFAGDREDLERAYEMRYEIDKEDEAKWALVLVPRKKPLTEMLKSLRLEGSGSAVSKIEMFEPNGDKTVTTVLTNNPKRRFTIAEKKALFGIEADKSDSRSE